jgi:hypothetical protein
MSSHVGTVIVGSFLPKKEAGAEKLGGQTARSVTDPNISFEQGKPRCMSVLLTHRVLYNLCLQMYCALTYRILMKMKLHYVYSSILSLYLFCSI